MASSPNQQGQKTPSSRKTANVEPWSSAEVGTGNESMQWPSPLLVKASCPRVGPCSLSSTARKTRWRENGQQVRATLSTRTALLSRRAACATGVPARGSMPARALCCPVPGRKGAGRNRAKAGSPYKATTADCPWSRGLRGWAGAHTATRRESGKAGDVADTDFAQRTFARVTLTPSPWSSRHLS